MKFKCLKSIFTAAALALATLANAGLITNTSNDSFIDETTGLEWMDFGINNGQSFNYVALQTSDGGIYESWRLPSTEEVYAMWANAFYGLGPNTVDWFGSDHYRLFDGQSIIGSVFTNVFVSMGYNRPVSLGTGYDSYQSSAYFYGTDGLSYVSISQQTGIITDISSYDAVIFNDRFNYNSQGDSSDILGSTLLVRKTNDSRVNGVVSEPSTIGIFALGLMSLGLGRFKKNL